MTTHKDVSSWFFLLGGSQALKRHTMGSAGFHWILTFHYSLIGQKGFKVGTRKIEQKKEKA